MLCSTVYDCVGMIKIPISLEHNFEQETLQVCALSVKAVS